jgi:hypothetical protein
VTFGFQNTAKAMNIVIAILATAVTVDLFSHSGQGVSSLDIF